MDNHTLADMLDQLANLLAIQGGNPYRSRAYKRAARVIRDFPTPISELIEQKADLTSIRWIGKGIAYHLREIYAHGKIPDVLKKPQQFKTPLAGFLQQIIGSKRLFILENKLKIENMSQLHQALRSGLIKKEFGPKLEEKILIWLSEPKKFEKFIRIYHAIPVIESLLSSLRKLKGMLLVECAGDYRRKQEVVGGLDIIFYARKNSDIFSQLISLYEIKDIIEITETRASFRLHTNLQINLRKAIKENFYSALLFYTGSESHLKELHKLAKKSKLKLTPNGLMKAHKIVANKTEKEIYGHLKLQYIPPELRENRGEIEAARKNQLPHLITLQDIKGDLHSHTHETDGTDSLEDMVNAAIAQGYEYVAITDHSQSLKITNGMDETRLLKQIKQIDKMNAKLKNFRILKSMEIDILSDGSLDLSDDMLKELDIRVCSIHSRFRIPEKEQTERILRAMDNPYFNILGHATGRLIYSRKPYDIDIEKIFKAAKDRNCFIELNAQPYRLDIHDQYCKLAKEMGVKIAISSDAHTAHGFSLMQLGINQARRGWLERDDVINTRSWSDLEILIKRK